MDTKQEQTLTTQQHLPLSTILKQRGTILMQKQGFVRSENAQKFLLKHPKINEWYVEFGPDAQMTLCDPLIPLGAVSAMTDDECPTLALLMDCYINQDTGKNYAMEWMQAQLKVLNRTATTTGKLSDHQINILALDLFQEYYYWNLAEVCIFLGKTRRGEWGHFYGTIDNVMLMEWAKKFNLMRRDELERYEKAVEAKLKAKKAASEHTISIHEWAASLTEEQRAESILCKILKEEPNGQHSTLYNIFFPRQGTHTKDNK